MSLGQLWHLPQPVKWQYVHDTFAHFEEDVFTHGHPDSFDNAILESGNHLAKAHIPRSHRSRLSRDSPREIQNSGGRRRQEEGISSNHFPHAKRSLPPASLLTCSSTPPHALLKQACS